MTETTLFLGVSATKACGGVLRDKILPAIYQRAQEWAFDLGRRKAFLEAQFHVRPDFPQGALTGPFFAAEFVGHGTRPAAGTQHSLGSYLSIGNPQRLEFGIFDLLVELESLFSTRRKLGKPRHPNTTTSTLDVDCAFPLLPASGDSDERNIHRKQ